MAKRDIRDVTGVLPKLCLKPCDFKFSTKKSKSLPNRNKRNDLIDSNSVNIGITFVDRARVKQF